MQHSYLLSIDFKVYSLTDGDAQLKNNPLFAILSGFEFDDAPGIGTFFDFLIRLLDSKDNHLSPHIHPVKVKKLKIKGAKANSVEKFNVEQLLPQLENSLFNINNQHYRSLFVLYQEEFLNQSVAEGLISIKSLAVAGDGTPVVISHRE